jgi:hypothetical protein
VLRVLPIEGTEGSYLLFTASVVTGSVVILECSSIRCCAHLLTLDLAIPEETVAGTPFGYMRNSVAFICSRTTG